MVLCVDNPFSQYHFARTVLYPFGGTFWDHLIIYVSVYFWGWEEARLQLFNKKQYNPYIKGISRENTTGPATWHPDLQVKHQKLHHFQLWGTGLFNLHIGRKTTAPWKIAPLGGSPLPLNLMMVGLLGRIYITCLPLGEAGNESCLSPTFGNKDW